MFCILIIVCEVCSWATMSDFAGLCVGYACVGYACVGYACVVCVVSCVGQSVSNQGVSIRLRVYGYACVCVCVCVCACVS